MKSAVNPARNCPATRARSLNVARWSESAVPRLTATAYVFSNPSGGNHRVRNGLLAGAAALGSFGIDVAEIGRSRRSFAGECIDWTQRRGHLNGALGAAIAARLFELGWITRGPRRRSVLVTAAGTQGLADTFGLDLR